AARVAMIADPADRQSWYARSRSRAAAALLFAAPGIPALFMGQEILEDKLWCDDEKNDPGHLIRWDGLATEPTMADYRRFMRDLIALRRRQPALNADGVRASRVNDFDRLIVVHRWVADGRGQDVVAVVSFDEQPKYDYRVGLPRDGEWIELFNTDITTAFPILSRSATGESSTRTARRSTASRSRPRSPSRQTAHSFFGPRTRRSRQVRAAQRSWFGGNRPERRGEGGAAGAKESSFLPCPASDHCRRGREIGVNCAPLRGAGAPPSPTFSTGAAE